MAKYPIAHIREQGVDIIIVPLDPKFGRLSKREQSERITHVQACTIKAGLAGTVVPVWQEGDGFRFIGPNKWLAFFQSISWDYIVSRINAELTCS